MDTNTNHTTQCNWLMLKQTLSNHIKQMQEIFLACGTTFIFVPTIFGYAAYPVVVSHQLPP